MFRKRVRPEYVLRQTVSLYAITRKEAIFVETPEGINIYSSDVHPFFVVAQFLNAANVIKISIREFVSLAENIGDPTTPIIPRILVVAVVQWCVKYSSQYQAH